LLSYIAQGARGRGIRFLTGRFIPTPKNQPAKSFFGDHGFSAVEDLPDGSTWQLDLRKSEVPWPDWIQLLRTEALAR
jgi:predicted enzyme involved in methoxymalonyl-ACP biosynthesis